MDTKTLEALTDPELTTDKTFFEHLEQLENKKLKGELRRRRLDERYTPKVLVDLVRDALDIRQFNLDPFSCAVANAIVDANRFFTRADDGLSLDWFGHVYVNVPGSIKRKAYAKVIEQVDNPEVKSITVLEYNTDMSTPACQMIAKAASVRCDLSDRYRFHGGERQREVGRMQTLFFLKTPASALNIDLLKEHGIVYGECL